MNSSATDLRYLFISSVNDENWGDDLLTNDPLADGWFYPIDTADFGNGCEFDIVAVDADSWQTVLGEMSLCEITGIRLNYGGAEVTAIST